MRSILFMRVNNGLRNQLCKFFIIRKGVVWCGVELAHHMIAEVKNCTGSLELRCFHYSRVHIYVLSRRKKKRIYGP
jgi:hypothetical protein